MAAMAVVHQPVATLAIQATAERPEAPKNHRLLMVVMAVVQQPEVTQAAALVVIQAEAEIQRAVSLSNKSVQPTTGTILTVKPALTPQIT